MVMNSPDQSSPLQIVDEQRGATIVFRITGDLDASSAIGFARRLQEHVESGATQYIFDCRDLVYIASAGLGVFISQKDDVYDAGGRFVFFGLRPNVASVFRMLGLTDLFTFVATETEALAAA